MDIGTLLGEPNSLYESHAALQTSTDPQRTVEDSFTMFLRSVPELPDSCAQPALPAHPKSRFDGQLCCVGRPRVPQLDNCDVEHHDGARAARASRRRTSQLKRAGPPAPPWPSPVDCMLLPRPALTGTALAPVLSGVTSEASRGSLAADQLDVLRWVTAAPRRPHAQLRDQLSHEGG